MGFSVQQAFSLHERALGLRIERAEILAHNIANSDTPGYQARDFSFADAIRADSPLAPTLVRRTHSAHLGPDRQLGPGAATADLKYRVPLQPSLDQNTVETPVEQAEYMDNAVRYQAALQLLHGRIRGLLTAITGQ